MTATLLIAFAGRRSTIAQLMSLITRCPACGTMFKVVPDQLRISEGWVRCGQCDEVFDASLNMQDPLAVEALPSDAR